MLSKLHAPCHILIISEVLDIFHFTFIRLLLQICTKWALQWSVTHSKIFEMTRLVQPKLRNSVKNLKEFSLMAERLFFIGRGRSLGKKHYIGGGSFEVIELMG